MDESKMNRDDIIRIAREAGSIDSEEVIETVWAAFAEAEREACAKLCEVMTPTDADGFCPVAAAIRARGQE